MINYGIAVNKNTKQIQESGHGDKTYLLATCDIITDLTDAQIIEIQALEEIRDYKWENGGAILI